jgi:hypothetical protein
MNASSGISIQLKDGKTNFGPGETIAGRVLFPSSETALRMVGRLNWYSEGKGTEDAETVLEQKWESLIGKEHLEFAWPVPRGPLSLQGNLINIQWQIHFEFAKPNMETTRNIVIGPNAKAMRIPPVAPTKS